MSILNRLMHRSFGTLWGNPWLIPTNGELGSLAAGGPLLPTTAMQLAAVAASVRLLSTTVSGLPMDAQGPDGRKLAAQPDLVTDPFGGESSPDMSLLSSREGIRQIMLSLLTDGNAYVAPVDYDADGMVSRLMMLSPSRVRVDTGPDGHPSYMVDGDRVPNGIIGHIRGWSWPGEFVGISPLTYARRTIELGVSSEEFMAKFFRRGAAMSGVISVPANMSKDDARKMAANFEASHSGLANAYSVGVLTGGAEWKQVTVSPEDAQFLGTQAAKTLDVAMLYGIPPHMLGQVDRTTSWGKGIEEQTLGFLKFTCRGWTDPIEDFFTRMLGPRLRARFSFDELLKPDTEARFASYQVARTAGILTINEIRAREGLDPVDGGDDIMAPLNSAHTTDPGYELDEPDEPDTSDQLPEDDAGNDDGPTPTPRRVV